MVGRRNRGEGPVDPAYWDMVLAESGIPPQQDIEKGVFGGVPGADKVVVLPEDVHEQAIIAKHRAYGKERYSVVSPTDQHQMHTYADHMMRDRGDILKVSVHTSCVDDGSGQEYDSIIFTFKDGTQAGFNTRQMRRYSRDSFIRHMTTKHNVGVLER